VFLGVTEPASKLKQNRAMEQVRKLGAIEAGLRATVSGAEFARRSHRKTAG
jgi:hypothetical protein